jgi:hydroxymethylpyrimidine kinase/phosphomethylpyrimidine kinase
VARQIRVVADDLGIDAAKTGMLAGVAVVTAAADALRAAGGPPLVVDPVLASTSGHALFQGRPSDLDRLVAMATVATPNLAEAAALAGMDVADREGMERAARAIVAKGARAVLVTGGHLDDESSPDCLVLGDEVRWLDGARVDSPHTHGGGCVLAAAICAGLANGLDVVEASEAAKVFVTRAIAAGGPLGAGRGPVDPLAGWS